MNKNEKTLIDILSLAIRGQKAQNLEVEKINWDIVLNEAIAHGVQSLLYITLKDLQINSDSWIKFITLLKGITMKTAVVQMRQRHEFSKALLTLKEAGVQVIALKGIVLKDLYPNPELRTMGDVDLLIPIKDIELSRDILIQLGYKQEEADPKHIMLTHKSFITIELHSALLSKEKNKTKKEIFDKQLWQNITPIMVCGVEVYSLGCIDQLIHICLHMIEHMFNQGFGVRHLCDLVLYTEAVIDIIDWKEFLARTEELGIDYFVCAIFEVSKQLFGLKIPTLTVKYKIEQKTIDNLIFDIIKSGTFGHRTIDWKFAHTVIGDLNPEDMGFWLKQKNRVKVILSHSESMLEKYNYATKYPFLKPIAWVQYLADRTWYLILSHIAAKRRIKLFNSLKFK